MKVLFDQGVPVPLRRHLPSHDIATAFEMGWSKLQNGDLLREAEAAGFDVFLTTDQNLAYQQNLSARQIAVVVLPTTSWPIIQRFAVVVTDAVRAAGPRSFVRLVFSEAK